MISKPWTCRSFSEAGTALRRLHEPSRPRVGNGCTRDPHTGNAGCWSARSSVTGTASSLRAPDGKPSLQGNWDFRTITPLERPKGPADQKVLSANEAEAIQKEAEARRARAAAPSDVRN